MDSDSAFFFGAPLNLHVWISCSINQKQKPESVSTNLTTDAFQFCPLCQLLTKQRGIGALWRFCFHAYQTTKNYFCIPSRLSSCRQQVNPFTYLAVEAGVFFLLLLLFFSYVHFKCVHAQTNTECKEFWQPLMYLRIFGVLSKNFRQGSAYIDVFWASDDITATPLKGNDDPAVRAPFTTAPWNELRSL